MKRLFCEHYFLLSPQLLYLHVAGGLVIVMPRHSGGKGKGVKERRGKRGGSSASGGSSSSKHYGGGDEEDSSECCERLGNLELEEDDDKEGDEGEESQEEDQFGRKWPKIRPPFNVAMWDLGQCM